MSIDKFTAFRRALHANPELSGNEYDTQSRIKAFVEELGCNDAKSIAKTGLLCSFEFGKGPHLLIRVDCDALPIQEINDFEYKSTTEGVSHKCGHDGHTAIGTRLIQKLAQQPLKAGRIDVLFQPAEEIGEGARAVLEDDGFDVSNYDYALALHNIPGAPMHQVLLKKDEFTTAVHSLVIRLSGKTSHAAEPKKGINPGYAISEIIQAALDLEETDESHENYALITPVYANLGSIDYGISAGYGEVHFTIRSWKQAKMEQTTEIFREAVKNIAATHQLKLEQRIVAEFAANKNDHFLVDQLFQSSEQMKLKTEMRELAFPWGEDFGLFTQQIPGAMFGLGAGERTPALHNPDYDFPDELIETGANIFYETAKNILESNV